MKKFIAAFDGLNFNENTMRYAIYLAKQCNAHLVGVFLEDFTRRSYGVMEIARYQGEEVDRHIHQLDEKDSETRRLSIQLFQDTCREEAINFSIHRDRNVALQELLQESVYADLLIICSAETMTKYEEPAPSRFIRDLLDDVQCPVVLVPTVYFTIKEIVLLYDGEPSSVHAVRMFSYLFDKMQELDMEIVTVKKPDDSVLLPNARLIREFIHHHYPNAGTVILKGDAEDEIISYLKTEKRSPLIVLGAYRRTRFSRAFRPSMADHLVQNISAPLFIAHNKS